MSRSKVSIRVQYSKIVGIMCLALALCMLVPCCQTATARVVDDMGESINNVPALGCPCSGQKITAQPTIMPGQSQAGTVIQSNNNGQGSYTIQAPEQTFVSTTVSGQDSAPVAATSGQNAIDSSIKPMTGMKSIFSMMYDRGLFERSMPKIKTKIGTQKFPFAIAPRFNSLFW